MPMPRSLLKAFVVAVLISGSLFLLLVWDIPVSPLSWRTVENVNGRDECIDGICSPTSRETMTAQKLSPTALAQVHGGLLVDTAVSSTKTSLQENSAQIPSGNGSVQTSRQSATTSLRFPHLNNPTPFVKTPNHESTDPHSPFSYVFYALNGEELCSALINSHILRDTFSSPHNITLVHYTDLVTTYIPLLDKYDVNTIRVNPPMPPLDDRRQLLLKLYATGLTQYQRVVILEPDQLVFKPLDDLFTISMNKSIMTPSNVSTSLVVIRPSQSLHVDLQFPNSTTIHNIETLPPSYSVTTSYFERKVVPDWVSFSNNESIDDILWWIYRRQTHLLQFTEQKAWISSRMGEFINEKKKDAHPAFKRGFERWWELKNEVCPGRGHDGFSPETPVEQLFGNQEGKKDDTTKDNKATVALVKDDIKEGEKKDERKDEKKAGKRDNNQMSGKNGRRRGENGRTEDSVNEMEKEKALTELREQIAKLRESAVEKHARKE